MNAVLLDTNIVSFLLKGDSRIEAYLPFLATDLKRDKSGVQALPARKQSLHSRHIWCLGLSW